MADPGRRPERRWAVLRIVLGQAQMVGALVSLVLLAQTGLSELTALAVTVTVGCLVASRLLFGGRQEG